MMIGLLFCIVFAFSCKKEPEQSCGTCEVGGAAELSGFSFTKNGGTAIRTDSAFFNTSFNTITSFINGISYRINIKTSSQITGTYNFTTAANSFYYIEPSATYYATGGSLNITTNSNNKLSGNFITTGVGGGYTAINGQFKDIPKK